MRVIHTTTNAEKDAAYSDRTRAAVVDVLDLCTSLTAILSSCSWLDDDDSPFGLHSQTLPQFPKPIYALYRKYTRVLEDPVREAEGTRTSSMNWSLSARTWSEMEKMSVASWGGWGGGIMARRRESRD